MAFALLTRLAAAERTLIISRALGLGVTRWQTIETLFISNYYALLSPGPVLSGVVSVYRYRGYGAHVTGSVSTLLASRGIEAATFVALGTACLAADRHVPLAAVRAPLLLACGALVAVALCVTGWTVLHRRHQRSAGRGAPLPVERSGWLGQLDAAWRDIVRRGPRMAWQAAVPAAVQVLLSGVALSCMARALGIELALVTAVWVSAAVYAVVLLPLSVAGIGVRDLTLIRALGLLGIAPSLAVALAVLLLTDPLLNALIGGLWQAAATLATAPAGRTDAAPRAR